MAKKLDVRRLTVTVLLLTLLAASGCAGGADPHETQEQDILAAVQVYLREQRSMNPDGMSMKITQLELDGDEAQATIEFTSPNGDSNLEVEYLLSKGQDGWTVTRSPGQGGHGADEEGRAHRGRCGFSGGA